MRSKCTLKILTSCEVRIFKCLKDNADKTTIINTCRKIIQQLESNWFFDKWKKNSPVITKHLSSLKCEKSHLTNTKAIRHLNKKKNDMLSNVFMGETFIIHRTHNEDIWKEFTINLSFICKLLVPYSKIRKQNPPYHVTFELQTDL